MCIACVSAGKASGAFGCDDVSAAPSASSSDTGATTTNAAAAPGDGTTSETSGSDTVAGSTSTNDTMSIDTSVRGFINSNGDQDWYRVTLVAGQQYTFAESGFGVGALPDAYMRLYNASGIEILADDDSGGNRDARFTYTATTSGTYYISAGTYSGTGEYMLTMNDGATPFTPVVTVTDAANYLTNTYWETSGNTARHWASSTITFNLVGLEPERVALARTAFQLWADAANLTFVETTGTANITLDDNAAGAYSTSSVSGGLITSSVINVASSWYGGIDSIDSYTLQTFIHEIGHSLGLGHAGHYNGSAAYGTDNVYANDTWQMSIMSYMSQNNYAGNTYDFVMTPMMADIMAIQSLYGASTAHNGNTTYGFNATAGTIYNFATYTSAPSYTIYDNGGTDTLDASGYSNNQMIDLRAGNFSSIGGLTGNIGIYVTSVVENAVGGSGNDTITGNSANNVIRGGAGNDTIDGGAGTDTAVFSGVRAAYTLTSLGGTSVRVVGTDGTDTVSNVEYLQFDDQTLSWPLNHYDAVVSALGISSGLVSVGGSTTVNVTISNTGNLTFAASAIGIYLSTNATFDGGDTLLTTRSAPSLAGGASFSDSFSLTLSSGGTYYLFAVADYNNAVSGESNEGNNVSSPVQIGVYNALNVSGGGGDDNLAGGLANDNLSGFAGNDILYGAAGNDYINGGDGLDDAAVFAGNLSQYTVQDLGSRVIVSGPDGVDTVVNVEHLQFSNGIVHLRDGSGLFDTAFYDNRYADVFQAGVNALAHYQSSGWKEARDPNPFFSSLAYAGANGADMRAKGLSPIDHYHQYGWREGLDPGPNFDTKLYLMYNPDVAAAGIDPLEHYLTSGRAEGRQAYAAIGSKFTAGIFDVEYYASHYLDVSAAGVDPYQHFVSSGWKEGRNPNAYFDAAGYLAHNPDVAAAGVNPFDHYHNNGWKEGRDPSANFDVKAYLAANPDIVAAHIDPLEHFLKSGIYEGRMAFNDGHW